MWRLRAAAAAVAADAELQAAAGGAACQHTGSSSLIVTPAFREGLYMDSLLQRRLATGTRP